MFLDKILAVEYVKRNKHILLQRGRINSMHLIELGQILTFQDFLALSWLFDSAIPTVVEGDLEEPFIRFLPLLI